MRKWGEKKKRQTKKGEREEQPLFLFKMNEICLCSDRRVSGKSRYYGKRNIENFIH